MKNTRAIIDGVIGAVAALGVFLLILWACGVFPDAKEVTEKNATPTATATATNTVVTETTTKVIPVTTVKKTTQTTAKSLIEYLWDGITYGYTTEALNVRCDPSTMNERVGLLKKGEKVGVIGECEGFYKIKYTWTENGKKHDVGYVSKEYVRIPENAEHVDVQNVDTDENAANGNETHLSRWEAKQKAIEDENEYYNMERYSILHYSSVNSQDRMKVNAIMSMYGVSSLMSASYYQNRADELDRQLANERAKAAYEARNVYGSGNFNSSNLEYLQGEKIKMDSLYQAAIMQARIDAQKADDEMRRPLKLQALEEQHREKLRIIEEMYGS